MTSQSVRRSTSSTRLETSRAPGTLLVLFLAASLGTAILLATPWQVSETHAEEQPLLHLPQDFQVLDILGDAEQLLLFGRCKTEVTATTRRPGQARAHEAWEGQILRLRRDLSGPPWQLLHFLPGSVTHAARAGDGIYAAHEIENEDPATSGRMLRSFDDGDSWQPLDRVFPRLHGIAFHDRRLGYVWSERSVFRTLDGGASWQHAELPGGTAPQRAGYVNTEGHLVLAIDHGEAWEPSSNRVLRIAPDLTFATVLGRTDARIWALCENGRDCMWMLTEEDDALVLRDACEVGAAAEAGVIGDAREAADADEERAMTARYEMPGIPVAMAVRSRTASSRRQDSASRRVAGFPLAGVKYLGAIGSTIAVLTSEKGFHPDQFFVSWDGGKSWTARDRVPGFSLRGMELVSGEEMWTVGLLRDVFYVSTDYDE